MSMPPTTREAAAIRTLENLGYEYFGAEIWKPPIGSKSLFAAMTDDNPTPTTEMQGWATLADGSRVSIPAEECRAILAQCDAAEAKRKADMPTEQDAIKTMMDAFTRLRELGWGELFNCPKDGTSFKAIEAGSTGIHSCFYSGNWPDGYWMIGEGEECGPSHPVLYKLYPEDEAKRAAKINAARARYRAAQKNGGVWP